MEIKKVTIVNDGIIRLDEAANVGDTINLKALNLIDTSYIDHLIKEEKDKAYQDKIDNAIKLVNAENAKKVSELNNIILAKEKEIETNKKTNDLYYKNEIDNAINSQKELYEKNLSEVKTKYEKELSTLIAEKANFTTEKENALNTCAASYKEKIAEIEKDLNSKLNENVNKNKDDLVALKALYENKINDLNLSITQLNEGQKSLVENTTLKVQNQLQKTITDMEQAKNALSLQLTSLKESKDKDIKLKEQEVRLDLEKKINELTSQISALTNQKNALGIKPLGEALESWCNNEYTNYANAGAFNDCTWNKDNLVIRREGEDKGTKADYIFKVFNDSMHSEELTSVCCDMKAENDASTNKKNNSDHYAKLDKDRVNKNCKYALLISELNRDVNNDTPIVVVNGYSDMYMVRPQYFITFLSIIYSLANKYKDLINAKAREDIKFKDQEDLLSEYQAMKEKYLDKPIERLNIEIGDIKKNSEAISVANQKNLDACDRLITKTLQDMKDKIDRFDIKELAGEIDKLDEEDSNK